VLFVLLTEDIDNRPLPLNLEGIQSFFRIRDPPLHFISIPSISLTETLYNTIKVIQRTLIKTLNTTSIRQVYHSTTMLNEFTITQWSFLKHRVGNSTNISTGSRTERVIYPGLIKASKRWRARKEVIVLDSDGDLELFGYVLGKYATIGAKTKYPRATPGTPYNHVESSSYLNVLSKVEFMYIQAHSTLRLKCFYSSVHRSKLTYSDSNSLYYNCIVSWDSTSVCRSIFIQSVEPTGRYSSIVP